MQADRITILRHDRNAFTVIADHSRHITECGDLCFDEMLGHVAGLMMPLKNDGTPFRYPERDLFAHIAAATPATDPPAETVPPPATAATPDPT